MAIEITTKIIGNFSLNKTIIRRRLPLFTSLFYHHHIWIIVRLDFPIGLSNNKAFLATIWQVVELDVGGEDLVRTDPNERVALHYCRIRYYIDYYYTSNTLLYHTLYTLHGIPLYHVFIIIHRTWSKLEIVKDIPLTSRF